MKKRIEYMLESLTSCVENQLTHLESVDTKELGEAIDMIKDLEEAMYYCVITKAMEEKDESKAYYPVYMRDMDRNYGKMYYEEKPDPRMYDNDSMIQHRESGKGGGSSPWHNGGKHSTPQHERENNSMLMERDEKEGRSPRSRKSYMESKAQHSD